MILSMRKFRSSKVTRPDSNPSLTPSSQGKCGGGWEQGWVRDAPLQTQAKARINGTLPDESCQQRPRAGAPPEENGSPVGPVVRSVQQACLVQVSREAVQHPSFLDAVELVQALAEHLHDDVVRDCRQRRTNDGDCRPGHVS